MEFLDYEALAWMIMFDGSIKQKGARQIELHLQSFDYDQQERICMALYMKLGIKCWPSHYGKSIAGVDQYHIQISGLSLPLIKKEVEPFVIPSFNYKIPFFSGKKYTSTKQSKWDEFYEKAKQNPMYTHPLTKYS